MARQTQGPSNRRSPHGAGPREARWQFSVVPAKSGISGKDGVVPGHSIKMSLTFLHVADKKVHYSHYPHYPHSSRPPGESATAISPGELSDEGFALLKSFLFCSPSGETRLVRKAGFGIGLKSLLGLRLHGPTCQLG